MENHGKNSTGRDLATRSATATPATLSPDNLLRDSVGQLSPEQQSNLMAVAAHESLRLQAKRAESSIDIDIMQQKMNQVTGMARNLNKERMVGYRIEAEHAGTRLSVQRGCFAQMALLWIPVGALLVMGLSV